MVFRTKLDMEIVQREVHQHLQALRTRGFNPPTTPQPAAHLIVAPAVEQQPGFAEEPQRALDGTHKT